MLLATIFEKEKSPEELLNTKESEEISKEDVSNNVIKTDSQSGTATIEENELS